jgi:hypothetical protein
MVAHGLSNEAAKLVAEAAQVIAAGAQLDAAGSLATHAHVHATWTHAQEDPYWQYCQYMEEGTISCCPTSPGSWLPSPV